MESFPCHWPFVRGIHRSPVNSPHEGQWRGAVMFSLICAWINGWVNNHEAGDLRRHHAPYDVIVMNESDTNYRNGSLSNDQNNANYRAIPLLPLFFKLHYAIERRQYHFKLLRVGWRHIIHNDAFDFFYSFRYFAAQSSFKLSDHPIGGFQESLFW